MNKVLSAHWCSWLTTWWGKGVFYSPCSPCSKHNRVPHTHYLITSKNRFLHISSTRKLAEREKTYFSFYFSCQLCLKQCHTEQLLDSFHTSFSSQGVNYTNVSVLGAPGALLLLPSLCWIHLVPEAPFQPSLGSGPALLTPQQHWLCVGIPRLYITAWSPVLSPASSPSALDRSSWMVLSPYSSLPMSGATGGLCYSHCLCPLQPEPVGQHPLVRRGVTLMPLWEDLSLTEESSSDNTSVEKWWQWTTFISQYSCVQAVRNISDCCTDRKHLQPEPCALWWLCTGARAKGLQGLPALEPPKSL